MAEELRPYPIPNLIQGVSQQTAAQRRDTQAEEQFDCVNSPINGAEARPHFDLVKFYPGANALGAFSYEIFRGDTEHYLAMVIPDAQDWGLEAETKLHVIDWNTGDECAVTFTATEDYLAGALDPKDGMIGATVNDNNFIGNREVLPAMDSGNTAPAQYNEGIVYVKAGAYASTYQCVITYNGKVYVFTYTTPDNSDVANAPYIATNQIAATFYRAFTGTAGVPHTSGTSVVVSGRLTNANVGAVSAGETTGVSASVTLTTLGFYVGINGNCVIIGRNDANPFKIDVSDGVGGTYFMSAKDNVASFNDLPKTCFEGFTTKVSGTNQNNDDDYWVSWTGQDGSGGSWQEVPKPGISVGLDAATMPHVLLNTGVNTFEWKEAPWGERVSGDGEISSPDPSFVGNTLRDMWYDSVRFVLMCEGSVVYSRSKNPFVWFPDTAKTTLDTDPVDFEVGGGKTIALLRKAVQVDESTFLWAPKIQFRVTSGNNPFRQDTVEAKPVTRFEFAAKCTPQLIGDSLLFANEPGSYMALKDLLIQDGKPRGVTDITGHVLKYIPSGGRFITGSDTLACAFVYSEGEPNVLNLYNFLIDGEARKRLQSAWNKWRLPRDSVIVWTAMSSNVVYAVVQRPDGVMFVKCDLSVDRRDDDPGAAYLTRLDFRVNETQLTLGYDPDTDRTTVGFPYAIPDGATARDGDLRQIFVANRLPGTKPRGYSWQVADVGYNTVEVVGDCTGEKLYAGFQISAEREDSRVYLRDQNGVIPTKSIAVRDYVVSYAQTGYTRAVIDYVAHVLPQATISMEGREWGDPLNSMGGDPIRSGNLVVPINTGSDNFKVRLINDTFLPSRWTSALYTLQVAFYAQPRQSTRSGGAQ